ncbi:hypothetical protein [Streptomyces sp. NPDC053048]|uniref:hypothetical protein n=1 Tax=Streptomyces sp. NPDC053048 TaxID=3365694 RepID=UPI0037D350CE
MGGLDALLYVDFDGNPADDIDDVIYGAVEDPRHLQRVPGFTALMNDVTAPELERFVACMVLTAWGERAGYEAVLRAAADPRNERNTPWYDFSVDRKFSVDSTFAQLAWAVGLGGDLAEEKGTTGLRIEALRALVRIADSEYFDEKLEPELDEAALAVMLDDVEETIRRGVRSLVAGDQVRFDRPTQLVDLACAVALVDAPLAVDLAMEVIAVASYHRVLNHAMAIVDRADGPDKRRFAEYVLTVGDADIRARVAEALEQGDRP